MSRDREEAVVIIAPSRSRLCSYRSLTVAALRLPLRFATGADQLGRAARRGLEEQLLLAAFLADADGDGVLASEVAVEQILGQRVFEIVLDGPAQRTGAVFQARALLDQEVLGFLGQHQGQVLL